MYNDEKSSSEYLIKAGISSSLSNYILSRGDTMSLISFIATNKFISFASDGRVIDTDKGIIDENYKKITKVNNKIILGISGSYHASKIINENLQNYNQSNAKSFANSIFNELGGNRINQPVQFIIGGLDSSNDIYYAGFNERDYNLTEIYPGPNSIRHGFSGTDAVSAESLGLLINKSLASGMFGLEEAKTVHKEFNLETCNMDNSVNDKLFIEYISKF